MTLQLQIITPAREVLRDSVEELIVPTESGEIGILPDHEALLTKIKPGEMAIKKNQKLSYFAITGGFLEVKDNTVTILADYAVRAEDIEVAKAKEAQERAQNSMKQKVSERDFALAESELIRSLVQLDVARKRRKSS